MSGLFGYFDPDSALPPETVRRMSGVLGCPADRTTTILRGPQFAIGCASKGAYAGEGDVLSVPGGPRHALHVGRLFGFSGEAADLDARTAARRAFVEDCTPTRLAAANGPFAAAVWDAESEALELITDRYGMYPLYLARHEAATLFASQLKALLAADVLPVEFDPCSVALMLTIGEMVGSRTLVRGVEVLPAGARMVIDRAGARTTKYWRYDFDAQATDFDASTARVAGLLRTAVERVCTPPDASIGVPLSGGLDSRVLLAATPDPHRVPSFTWGLEGCRELRYAAAAAEAVGSPHQTFTFDGGYLARWAAPGVWITEGQLPATDFHVLPFMEHVGRDCTVILNGFAGDALLGGNFLKRAWMSAPAREPAGDALWRWRDSRVAASYRAGLFGPAMEGAGSADARIAFLDEFHRAPGRTPADAAMAFLLDNRVRRFTSCGTSLVQWHVESAHPFFDNDLLDCLTALPHAWRFRHRCYVTMLRRHFPAVARVPWQRTGLAAGAPPWMMYPALAAQKLGRFGPLAGLLRGKPLVDFPNWMRGPLRPYLVDTLLGERTCSRGLCRPDTLRRIVGEHLDGRMDNSGLIGALLAVELFARLFVDRDVDMIAICRVPAPAARTIEVQTVS